MHNEFYHKQIIKKIFKIDDSGSLSSVDIPWIRNVCNKADIGFANIDEYLSLEQMIKELVGVEGILHIKIMDKYEMLDKICKLAKYITIKKLIRTRQDTADKKSMGNVISTSILMCVIAILCIVLLIAVNNKNQANTGVKLLHWA